MVPNPLSTSFWEFSLGLSYDRTFDFEHNSIIEASIILEISWRIGAMGALGFVARLWFYFRMGYATYLTFLLGFISTLVTVYYLAIKNIPYLLDVFPHFVPFAFLAVAIGLPLSIAVGWVHYKRSPAFSSEIDIQVEANPYYFKLPPGYNREVFAPVYLELMLLLKRLRDGEKTLSNEERARIENLEKKLQVLIDGGMVGTPRRKL
jgi:hypothetical protein